MSKEQQLRDAAAAGDLKHVTELLMDPTVDVNLGDQEMHERTALDWACRKGHLEVVKVLLDHQWVDPNKPNQLQAVPFLVACGEGHSSIVSLFLADQRIDVNKSKDTGATPFFIACQQGHASVVSILLADPRTDINQPKNDNSTPLWTASQNGHLSVVQIMLASGRSIDTKAISRFNNTTAAKQGRRVANVPQGIRESEADFLRSKANGPIIADLIDSFEQNPELVKSKLRRLPAIRGRFIGYVYSLIVLAADSYLTPAKTATDEARRFFAICSRLPMDLQMVLSNNMFGSYCDVVKRVDSEKGFRWAFQS